MPDLMEAGKVYTEWTIHKFSDRAHYEQNKPFEISTFARNVLLNEGIAELLDLLIANPAQSEVPFNQANTALGVGPSTASSGVATSTGLLSTAAVYVQCSTGYPTRVNQTATWRAVFSSGQANFNWREFAVRNSLTSTGRARDLNRRVSNQGTKVAGQTWTLDIALTIS